MLVLASLNDRLSRRALENLQQESRRASQYVELAAHAEILQALGMTQEPPRRWRALQRINAEEEVQRRGVVHRGDAVLRQSVRC